MTPADKVAALWAHYEELWGRKPTQALLAEVIGTTQASVSRWMKGGKAEGDHAERLDAAYLAILDGPPPTRLPVMGMVGAGAEIEPDYEQVPPEGIETVEIHLPLPPGLIGFKVVGSSMFPRFVDGTVLVVWREPRHPVTAYYGHEVVVRLRDGRRFVKTLLKAGDGVALQSWNDTALIQDIEVEWIGEIECVVPPRVGGASKPVRSPR